MCTYYIHRGLPCTLLAPQTPHLSRKRPRSDTSIAEFEIEVHWLAVPVGRAESILLVSSVRRIPSLSVGVQFQHITFGLAFLLAFLWL